ncbi:MAG: hypothetical protein JST09_19200 [Bacteroidetes bacterium]|nr:hypothetical protein [Bacteroidota bacterium]
MGTQEKKNNRTIILLSGLLVGTLDITAACTDYYIATGKGPGGVLRFVASGVFGQDAFNGNNSMLVWGLLFHFIIAFSFTIFFFRVYPRIKFMQAHPVWTAILYGIFMWIVTTRIIIPLSNTPKGTFVWWKALKAIAILVLMIGLPLSFIARKCFSRKPALNNSKS